MGKYSGILMCSDYDGTLFRTEGGVSTENIEAIKHFQDNGGIFTIASGRRHTYFAHEQDYFVPNAYIMGINGATMYDGKESKLIFNEYMGDLAYELIEHSYNSYKNLESLFLIGPESHIILKMNDPLTTERIKEVFPEEIYKVVLFGEPKYTEIARDDLLVKYAGVCGVFRSDVTNVEIQAAHINKGTAVLRLREMLGESIHTLVCVGDHENDISMVKVADIGYAVANATPELKAVADRITVSNNDHAIAKIIYSL